jgi:inward rectifier potassium channel
MSTPANAANPRFDPGLTQQYTGSLLRAINKDGSFNVRRRGLHGLAGNIYTQLVNMSWPRFLGLLASAFLLVNMLFASVYLALGPGAVHASQAEIGLGTFGGAFFFSAQTLTTVGYGAIYPVGLAAHIISSFEVTMGLLGFALATGLVFARFSRPSSKLVFSDQMVVAPFGEGTSLQFRVANQRSNVIAEVEARMLLMTVEYDARGELKRNFAELSLERKSVLFLALTWNIVHPIDEASPLWGKSREDLERMQAELLILIKGYDDSFSQVVHTRYSYRWDEIEWSARFVPAFGVSPGGHMVLDVGKISEIARV